MLRNIFGSLLALIGAVLAVWSPFRIWYGGRQGSDIRVDDLFTGVGATPTDAALLGSLFLPLGFAALLALLGVLLRSRTAVGAAGVLVLGITVLWMVRQGQSAGSLTAGGDGLDVGVAAAFGSGALLLLGAYVLPGRNLRRAEPPPSRRPPVVEPPPDLGPPRPYADRPATAGPAADAAVDADAYAEPYADAEPYTDPYADAAEPAPTLIEPAYRPEDDDTLTLPPLPDRPPG